MRTTIDVRTLEPREKHPTIINTLQEAEEGYIVEIINDHDPIPLYYQLQAIIQGGVNWNYINSGPEEWKVEISRKHKPVILVKDLVRSNPNSINIFRKLGIDYCCNGKLPLKQACINAGVSYEEVIKELYTLDKTELNVNVRINNWPLDFLIDYIVFNHHSYVRESIPSINFFLEKVGNAHGGTNPEIFEIKTLFSKIATELVQHMEKEEEILFPAIKQLLYEIDSLSSSDDLGCDIPLTSQMIESPIKCMEQEHQEAGEILRKITKLTNNYTPPSHACNSFQHLYRILRIFEEDLLQHVHLENNILFEKAIEIEKGIAIA